MYPFASGLLPRKKAVNTKSISEIAHIPINATSEEYSNNVTPFVSIAMKEMVWTPLPPFLMVVASMHSTRFAPYRVGGTSRHETTDVGTNHASLASLWAAWLVTEEIINKLFTINI